MAFGCSDGCSFIGVLVARLALDKGDDDMRAQILGEPKDNKFSLSGNCPHCNHASVFMIVAPCHAEKILGDQRIEYLRLWAIMQCQGCCKYLLGCAERPSGGSYINYVEHYPVGLPNTEVAREIPGNIAADLKEALRCRFAKAYNATVEMCRRATQASCIQLGAPANETLVKQIDWLAQKGLITNPLKEMAHRVRLGGNLGAHPPEDPNDSTEIVIGSQYADAVIEFTQDFFQHVYVMPERLKRVTFKKSRPDARKPK